MNKVSCYEKVSKRNGYSRTLEFSLREIRVWKNKEKQNDFYAQYEVKVNNVKDIYHTTYYSPTAEPENGYHADMMNNNFNLENDITLAINEHLWDFVGQYDEESSPRKVVQLIKNDYGFKLKAKSRNVKQ